MSRWPILSRGELVEVEVTDPDEESLAGTYWNVAYDLFLSTGNAGLLVQFRGQTVVGYPLETNPDVIEGFYFSHGPVDVREYYKQ